MGVQLDCHLDFVQLCGVCTPRCAKVDLSKRSGAAIRVADVAAVLAGVFGLIGFVVHVPCHGNYKEKANVRRK